MKNREALDDYFSKYAAPIRADHTRMWEGKVSATRSILHVVGKQNEQVCNPWMNADHVVQCLWKRITKQGVDECYVDLDPLLKESELWKGREARNAFRLSNLQHQVASMPKYTPSGFHVQKTPAELWGKIQV